MMTFVIEYRCWYGVAKIEIEADTFDKAQAIGRSIHGADYVRTLPFIGAANHDVAANRTEPLQMGRLVHR